MRGKREQTESKVGVRTCKMQFHGSHRKSVLPGSYSLVGVHESLSLL